MGIPIGQGPSSINLPDFSELENHLKGFASYNDEATETTPITVVADTWTDITCDGTGSGTNVQHLPVTVNRLWDVVTNEIKLDELANSNFVTVRLQFKAVPVVNDVVISVRVDWTTQSGANFQITKRIGQLNEGSGVEYEPNRNKIRVC